MAKMNDTRILNRVVWILDRLPIGKDEPISGTDAVDALNEIKQLIDNNRR